LPDIDDEVDTIREATQMAVGRRAGGAGSTATVEEKNVDHGVSSLDEMLERPTRARNGTGGHAVSGHLEGIDDEGRLLFRAEGASEGSVPVAIGIEVSDAVLVKAARRGQRALVMVTSDPEPRWVLVGLVRDRVSAKARDARPGQLEVRVDGEKVCLSADRQIELRCGDASLLLRKDGKIVVSGTNVISASRGPNRIRGATVSLN
jgi:hypothetical protein